MSASTYLFADLSGFTRLSEKLDPEEVRDIVQGFFARVVPEIEAEGGRVVQYIGDEVKAVFNEETLGPDHPMRACAASIAILRSIEVFQKDPTGGRSKVVIEGIGVHGGAGPTEGEAKTLADAAPSGAFWVAEETAKAGAAVFKFAPVEGGQRVAGYRDGIEAGAGAGTTSREAAAAGERRPVAVMFADFTPAPDAAAKEAIEQAIKGVGGSVDKWVGARVMALFGAERAHADDAYRACLAAGRLREKSGEGMKAGVNLGLAVFSAVGIETGEKGAGHVERTVLGDSVNIAARLVETAKAGEVLVSDGCARLCEDRITFGDTLDLSVAGKIGQVRARHLETAAAGRGAKAKTRGAFAGRPEDLKVLTDWIEKVRNDGKGGCVAVLGEAGIGKSALVAEVLRRTAAEAGVFWVEGRCAPMAESFAASIPQTLLDWVGKSVWDPAEERAKILKGKLLALKYAALKRKPVGGGLTEHPHAEDVGYWKQDYPYLARLINAHLTPEENEKVKHLDGRSLLANIKVAYANWIESRVEDAESASGKKPVCVLWIEDAHWLDEWGSEIVQFLYGRGTGKLGGAGTMPMLVVVTMRPVEGEEQHLGWKCLEEMRKLEAGGVHLVSLAGLHRDEMRGMVAGELATDMAPAALRGQQPEDALVEFLMQRTSGHPLFAKELLRVMLIRDVLRMNPGGVGLTSDDVELPDTIRGAILARLDRLDPILRKTLQRASVIGMEFDESLLEAVEARLGEKENLPLRDRLMRLVDEGFLDVVSETAPTS